MNLLQFNQLHDIQKEEIVFNKGTFLSTHHDGNHLFDTYRFDTFYVQFSYKIEGKDSLYIQTSNDLLELILCQFMNIYLN